MRATRAAIQRAKPIPALHRRQKQRIAVLALAGARRRFREIGLDPEILLEVGIIKAERVVQEPIAEENDLGAQRDRVRHDRAGVRFTQEFAHRIDSDGAVLSAALRASHAAGSSKSASASIRRNSAICLLQCARAQHREIGMQRAKVRDLVHAADETRISRMRLDDDRPPVEFAIVDDEIDRIAHQRIGGLDRPRTGLDRQFARRLR